jgi:Cu(I)/Ag(I) efflux system membrane fusion protein
LKAEPAKYLAQLQAAPAGEVLSVPESAVIDTGDRKVVYVEAQPGVFEGREVVLGPRAGDRFPVLEGLSAGQRVAAAGAFLIDAESRLTQGSPASATAVATGPALQDKGSRPAPDAGTVHRH